MRGPKLGSSIFGKALNVRPVKPERYGLIVRPKFDRRYMDQIGQKNKPGILAPDSRAPGPYGAVPGAAAGAAASSVSSAITECANEPPARISAATQMASMISSGVAPARTAALVWPWMQ